MIYLKTVRHGPSEFVYLESHAEFIFTDSFHSSVFAILYHRPFVVFNREGKRNNMNSRINTLLTKFKLTDRLYIEDTELQKYDYDINFNQTEAILNKERKKFKRYIEENV